MNVLLLLALLQQGEPDLTVTVDRTQIPVGQEIVLTLRASSPSDAPIRVSVPPLTGFEVLSRSERTEVAFGNNSARISTLELHLRALTSGTARLGPFSAEQSGTTVRAGPVTVMVSAGQPGARTLSPRVLSLLQRAPPPRTPGEPALTVVASATELYVGEQVDVVTAAWFPRDLRARLRRPPTLTPPSLSGVWSYPQPTPPGIAASRRVGDTWYDLFVSHQIVFPLVPGGIPITSANLQYSVPVALQFFSQEERFTLQSNADTLTVLALPDAGRPADFQGAVGRRLSLNRSAASAARAGEAIPIAVAISGQGNVALWPEPSMAWPGSTPHYQDRTDDRIANSAGLLGGTKTFRYLALPDSAGPLRLPPLSYSYFDLESRSYRTLTAGGSVVQVAPPAANATSRPEPPALIGSQRPALADQVWEALPIGLWLVLAAVPALGWIVWDVRRRPGRKRRRAGDREPVLPGSDRRLLLALRTLIPDADLLTGSALVRALRAAGIDARLAHRISDVRERYLQLHYGPVVPGDATEESLAREMDALTHALGGQSRHRERRGRALLSILLLASAATSTAWSQEPPAEALYQNGAYRAAAASFARRASAAPDVPAHWYGLGAAEYRAGSDARARVAWLHAARHLPRAATIRRALALVPPVNDASRRATWVAPVTVSELALAALLAWVMGWGFAIHYRRVRLRSAVLLSAALGLGAAAVALQVRYDRALALAIESVALRVSPHERAPEVAVLEPGQAVHPRREAHGWWLVDAGGRRSGWLPGTTLGRVDQ